ncbi:hypothetical protein NE237_002958 [Protea cynaroides]|uniref:Uncharacterized protein n=1 Tax=Protea cynaroides TaxID=273540 RepID=A0A9Q0KG56_9MAGN|nr:hypothetical protein NE237_002958 [Protea cynaroides]
MNATTLMIDRRGRDMDGSSSHLRKVGICKALPAINFRSRQIRRQISDRDGRVHLPCIRFLNANQFPLKLSGSNPKTAKDKSRLRRAAKQNRSDATIWQVVHLTPHSKTPHLSAHDESLLFDYQSYCDPHHQKRRIACHMDAVPAPPPKLLRWQPVEWL